jgi:hypothetical protein
MEEPKKIARRRVEKLSLVGRQKVIERRQGFAFGWERKDIAKCSEDEGSNDLSKGLLDDAIVHVMEDFDHVMDW